MEKKHVAAGEREDDSSFFKEHKSWACLSVPLVLPKPVSTADGAERVVESCCDESTNEGNSNSSQVSDMDNKTSFNMVSLLNLDEDQISEAENYKEPLFWPYDDKGIDWNSEKTWKCFAMSPRKDNIIMKFTTTPQGTGTSSKSTGSGLNKYRNMNMNLPTKCRRKLVFDSGSKILQLKQGRKGCCNKNNTNGICRNKKPPSRLRDSTNYTSAKKVPLDCIHNHVVPLQVEQVATPSTNFWDNICFASNYEDLPIETVIGLGEFDGHEGIDLDFNEAVFVLDQTL
ncbi:hypothetical protein COLO4_24404 [Corchorus olitorius]|uniref:Uncharacterized protein n=1 Tax=Corchorus olitorius TaxID=93759 RepID=A0A1R3IAB8_9ROSI|nr:hypothetical protein COLO4_24404 [Corchorus olitorius]